MGDVVVHKRQAVIDRLKRRMEGYRRHNQDCVPRYNNAFAEQQNVQETLMLKQKYMETKPKRNVKKNDKKPMENGNNTMPVFDFKAISRLCCANTFVKKSQGRYGSPILLSYMLGSV